MQQRWYAHDIHLVLKELQSSEHGIRKEEAFKRISHYGPNTLPQARQEHFFIIFLRQFQSPLIYVLLAVDIIVFFLHETTDGFIILFVLLFNALVGSFQEGKAHNILRALKQFTETYATVIRDSKEDVLPDRELVPGDVIILREGEKVPADARVIAAYDLTVNEAALTGESLPVPKQAHMLHSQKDIPVPDQSNMIFKGTLIVKGNGKAVVVATGLHTVIGNISKKISTIQTDIPLKVEVERLSRIIVIIILSASVLLFGLGILMGNSIRHMFITVASLAVSVVPEGLPIVLTLVLATGVWRMAKRNALVKRLHAVEALGQARTIAVDKTGTLTKNELVLEYLFVNNTYFRIDGNGYHPHGNVFAFTFTGKEQPLSPHTSPELLFSSIILTLSAQAHLLWNEKDGIWHVSGDPTEGALLVFGKKIGRDKETLLETYPLIHELPFSYTTKFRATLHDTCAAHTTSYHVHHKGFLILTGAPEVILKFCTTFWQPGDIELIHDLPHGTLQRFTHDARENITRAITWMSEQGLRVLAFAIQTNVSSPLSHKTIPSLVFVGLCGIRDAIRPEAQAAVKTAQSAGIRVLMITGDHKVTARAIAKEVGIYHEGDSILTGEDLDTLPHYAIQEQLPRTSVFARVTPEHKLRIIEEYRHKGDIIAMTGDGVNDAPPLIAADLGIAMGKIGTEVAKEASDIILLDDNFSSIVAAIEEGRNIYRTIQSVILYLFSTNLAEFFVITFSLFLHSPLPLLPSQIIWLNLVTDVFLVLALAMEPKAHDLLHAPFERPRRYFFDALMIRRMAFMVIPMALGSLILFQTTFRIDLPLASTITLTALSIFQWLNAWNCRSERLSLLHMNFFSNPYLVAATFISLLLHVAAIYTPFFQRILHTVPLQASHWMLTISIAFSVILVEEARKRLESRS